MKKIYICPLTEMMTVNVENHLLVESQNGGLTIDRTQTVDADLVKGRTSRQDYNVWNDDWSE